MSDPRHRFAAEAIRSYFTGQLDDDASGRLADQVLRAIDNARVPHRIRIPRRKGFNLQRYSVELNGLPAVNCTRPGRWANPHRVMPAYERAGIRFPGLTPATAVALYQRDLEQALRDGGPLPYPTPTRHKATREALAGLRGRNLACACHFCPAHEKGRPFDFQCDDCPPCHCDVLLDRANR